MGLVCNTDPEELDTRGLRDRYAVSIKCQDRTVGISPDVKTDLTVLVARETGLRHSLMNI